MMVLIDIETTGTRASRDRIIEIAALKVQGGQVIDQWLSLINPECRLPATIVELTGIDDASLQQAPCFSDIAHHLLVWLGNCELVAHNARFDYSFLRHEFKRAGLAYRARMLCTLRLSRQLEPDQAKHNLDALLDRHQIPKPAQHRATQDVLALWALWQSWQSKVASDQWHTLLDIQRRQRSLPAQIDPQQVKQIPRRPGVYLFYGHNQLPLYVGKSVNLHDRVMSHFQGDHQNDREMRLAQQVQHIEWEETTGDLGAQLREAQLIKTLMPIMNRRLRKQRRLYSWYWPTGDQHPRLIQGEAINLAHADRIFGLFRSAREAKASLRTLADTHQLCRQVLGLEKGRGRCFAHQLGRCQGACCQQESHQAHEARAKRALAQHQLNHWPWPGRIAIYEAHHKSHWPGYHLVSQWCYLGTVDHLPAADSLATDTSPFDLDTYQLLNRFLRDPKRHRLEIIELPT